MVEYVKRLPLGARAAAGILGLLLAGSVVLAGVSIRLRLAPHSSSAAQVSQTPSVQPVGPAAGPTSASIELASHELTPSSHFNLTAAGFATQERLALTVLDAAGHTYDAGALETDTQGKVVSSSLPPPVTLASGDYQLVVTGVTSHRRASAPFRMHDTPPTLQLERYTATPGQSIGFMGNNFFPGEKVSAFLGSSTTPLASVVATNVGAVSGRLTIPAAAPGSYDLSLVGKQSQIPAMVGFSVQGYSAWVVLDRYTLTPGQSVGFIGHGFAPNEQVFAYLNSTRTDPIMRLQADTSGQVIVQDTQIPGGTTGDNVLNLIGESSKATATAQFTILPGPAPSPSPASAPPAP
jgi:hypothetical protein